VRWIRHFSYSPHYVTPWSSLEICLCDHCGHSHYHHLHHIESTMDSGTTGISLINLAIFCRSLKFVDSYFPPFLSLPPSLFLFSSKITTTHKIWHMNTTANRSKHWELIQKYTIELISSYSYLAKNSLLNFSQNPAFIALLFFSIAWNSSHFSL